MNNLNDVCLRELNINKTDVFTKVVSSVHVFAIKVSLKCVKLDADVG